MQGRWQKAPETKASAKGARWLMKSELRKGERRRSSKIEKFDFSKFEKFGHRDRSEY